MERGGGGGSSSSSSGRLNVPCDKVNVCTQIPNSQKSQVSLVENLRLSKVYILMVYQLLSFI
jgi:hypothetical protein